MKNIVIERKGTTSVKKLVGKEFLTNYILNPIKSGIFGFSAFFSILIVTKLFSSWIGTYDKFAVDIDDVFLSMIGFILVFLIKFLENFKTNDN